MNMQWFGGLGLSFRVDVMVSKLLGAYDKFRFMVRVR